MYKIYFKPLWITFLKAAKELHRALLCTRKAGGGGWVLLVCLRTFDLLTILQCSNV